MSRGESSACWAGARLLWQRQRALWWLYGFNLLLGLLASQPVGSRTGRVLDSSLAAERLVKGFDLNIFFELLAQPEISIGAQVPGSVFSALLFLAFTLFLTGGVLESFRQPQRLTSGELFRAGAAFFWRFLRLWLFLLVVLVPVGILATMGWRWSGRLASDSPQPLLGFYVSVAVVVVALLVLMAIRLWFDMAQIRAVAEGERAMRRTVWRALKLTRSNFVSLFWLYFRISVVAWVGAGLLFWFWIRLVPAQAVGVSFLMGQLVVLLWTATRLWQRAAETVWYERQQAPSAPAPVSAEPPPAEALSGVGE
ncbi:MAG: hypothetical protein ACRD35_06925 [Candidatus Acidiferrales bacterium]